MRMIVALTALTIAMPAVAKTVTRLPSDVPVTDGFQNNNVCGTCCQDGAYCGAVPEDMLLADATRPTTNLLVPKGTNMTCILRARNVFGAVDGGLCVRACFRGNFPSRTCAALSIRHVARPESGPLIAPPGLAKDTSCDFRLWLIAFILTCRPSLHLTLSPMLYISPIC